MAYLSRLVSLTKEDAASFKKILTLLPVYVSIPVWIEVFIMNYRAIRPFMREKSNSFHNAPHLLSDAGHL